MSHFHGTFVADLIREQTRELEAAVNEMDEAMLRRPEAETVEELVETYVFQVPSLDPERVEIIERGEVIGRPGSVRVVYAIPFEGQAGLFSIQPSSILMTSFSAVVRDGELRFAVQQSNPTASSIEDELQKSIGRYEVALAQLRLDLRGFCDDLPRLAGELAGNRRRQLLRTQEVLASLAVPVRRREDSVIPVPVRRRVSLSKPRSVPGESFVPEWEVSLADYNDILASTRSMGLVMERAPGTFSGLTEEGIRDFFLALLNFGFGGEAMGEVFNGEGKTDILIRKGERNVFIAECKVWSGERRFLGVDQLLRYLGWRDTKCAILLFVHGRGISGIVDKVDAKVRAHDCFKRVGGDAVGELERRYVLHWPGDERRELFLTVQVFAVPSAKSKRTRRQSPAGRSGDRES